MLEALEHASKRARLLFQSDAIALLDTGQRELIRVGGADRREEAWWRYGKILRLRQRRFGGRLSRLGAATYSAVSYMNTGLGLTDITGDFRHSVDRYVDVMRWRLFGRTVWHGRSACPRCHSVLIRLFFYKSDALILLRGEDGQLEVGMPCSRCDPWTVEKVHRLDGAVTEFVLRRVLAYQNIRGATRPELEEAVDAIDEVGSAPELFERIASRPTPLYELPRNDRLALEIAVNATVEREQLAGEAVRLEASWRQAEEIAAIIDDELRTLAPR